MHQPWESRTDGEYFKLWKILREFQDMFIEYYRLDIKTFGYVLDSVKYDLQGCSNFRKCFEAEEKLTFDLRYALVIVVRINIICICTTVNATKTEGNLKIKYTRKSNSYTKLK
jgi:hypothetical protein